MRVLMAAAVAALLFCPAMASAQAAGTSQNAECTDDNGVDRCGAAQQAKTRALFDAAPIERLASEGAQVLRAFFVNGYGRDEAHIAFVRPKGADPEVIVSLPGGETPKRVAMRAPVPAATWNRLFARARYFDRALAALSGNKDAMAICLHSWVVTVEAAGQEQGRAGGVRRKTQDTCADGLAADLAFEMADAAVALFPACALLDPEQHRNAVTRLGACGFLRGDRIAAALAMNQHQSGAFTHPQPGTADSITYLFHEDAEVEWAGVPAARDGMGAAGTWVAQMQKRHFWLARVVGETPDRVRIEGALDDVTANDQKKRKRAEMVQIWTRENGFDFRLRSLKVSAFKPLRD